MEQDKLIEQDGSVVQVNDGNLPATRHGTVDMTRSAAEIQIACDEYSAKRKVFRAWLLGQMTRGVHYGVPPGCEPKLDNDGNILQWNNKTSQYITIYKDQWVAKPSLYKAGAELIADLFGLRSEFTIDNELWAQLGSQAGYFAVKCRVYFPNGELAGEGRGVFKEGAKGMNANSGIKMAQKSAYIDAVIYAAKVSDLFTMDIEDMDPIPRDKPAAAPEAPRVPPRAQRQAQPQTTEETLGDAIHPYAERWKKCFPGQTKANFTDWWKRTTGKPAVQTDPESLDKIDITLSAIEEDRKAVKGGLL